MVGLSSRVSRLLLLMVLSGCRCTEPVGSSDDVSLRIPETVDFGGVWLGTSRRLPLEVFNPGRAPKDLALVGPSSPAFRVERSVVRVAGGETVLLEVEFKPSFDGPHEASLELDRQPVRLRGLGQTPPPCVASTCRESAFDAAAGACVERVVADETPCSPESTCLDQGRCQAGTCRAAVSRRCEDDDACTVGACGEQGCVQLPVRCEISDPCRVARCDRRLGCVSEPIEDGAPCGPSTCREARVCVAGQCVVRRTQNQPEDCRYVQLAAAWERVCGLTQSGKVRCWGSTGCGFPQPFPTSTPLGTNYCFANHPPVEVVQFGTGVVGLAANVSFTLAVDRAGGLRTVPSGWPVPDAGSPFIAVACDFSERCAGLTRAGDAIGWTQWPLSAWEVQGPFRAVGARLSAILPDGGVALPTGPIALPAPARSLIEPGGGLFVLLENGELWRRFADVVRVPVDGGVSVFGVRGAGTTAQLCVARRGGHLECHGAEPLSQTLPADVLQIEWPCVLVDGGDVYCSRRAFQSVDTTPRLRVAGGRLLEGPTTYGIAGIATARDEITDPSTGALRAVPGIVGVIGRHTRVDGGTVFDARGTGIARDVVAEAWAVPGREVFHLQRDGGLLRGAFPTGVPDVVAVGGEALLLRDGGMLVERLGELVQVPLEPLRALGDARCALPTRGGVVCWEFQEDGGVTTKSVPAGAFPRQVSGSARAGCALSGENGLRCWGDNTYGQLGRVGPPSEAPLAIPVARAIRRVRHAETQVCIETELGVECWGSAPRVESNALVPWLE